MFFRASLERAQKDLLRRTAALDAARQLLARASLPREVRQANKTVAAAENSAARAEKIFRRAQEAARQAARRAD